MKLIKTSTTVLATVVMASLLFSACGTTKTASTTTNGGSVATPAASPSPSPTTTPTATPKPTATPTPAPNATATPATSASPAPAASPAATTVNAEAIIKANCISCHGATLDGNGNEKRNLTKVGSKLTKEQIVNQITNGGGGMRGFKGTLKDEEIKAVAEWLSAKK